MSILKEERHARNPDQARAPPHLSPSQTRIVLTQLWGKLPAENRRRALLLLGGLAARQLPHGLLGEAAPENHNDVENPAGTLGKGAGHEND